MAILTVLWEKWVEFRREWLRITLTGLVAPLLYILTFGIGLGSQMEVNSRPYLEFLIPGVVALTTMNASFQAIGMSLNVQRLYERSFDNILISPTPLWQYVLGQMIGGSLRGFYAGSLVLILSLPLELNLRITPGFFLTMLLNGMVFASLGVMAAVLSKTHAGISRFSSFVITPMSFLCGTFFSMEGSNPVLTAFIDALPLTQTATLLRSIAWSGEVQLWRIGILLAYNAVFLIVTIVTIEKMKNI